jgi:hypothetical protein
MKLNRFFIAFAMLGTCAMAQAQMSGVGTTGSTAGSGRGTGSGGVTTGGGPDVQLPPPEQPAIVSRSESVKERRTVETTKTKKSVSAKRLKKPAKNAKAAASPSPTPSSSSGR